jgi:hypothetical protein
MERNLKSSENPMKRDNICFIKLIIVFNELLWIVAFLSGCTHPLSSDFARRHSCPETETQITHTADGYTRVSGCGETEYYDCRAQKCVRETPSKEQPIKLVIDTSSSDKNEAASIERESDSSLLKTSVTLDDNGTQLLLMASLDKDPDNVGLEVSRSRTFKAGKDAECELQIMTAAGLMQLPATQQEVKGYKRYMRIRLPRRTFYTISASDYVVMRACDQRWPLNPSHIQSIRRFALALSEEVQVRERSGKLADVILAAPVGGWLTWSAPSTKSLPTKTKQLTADVLFKQLRPSTYTVDVKTATGSQQGSAVAVTSKRLLTNCHVLEGAVSIVLRAGDFELKTKLLGSDPNSDRCVLELIDGEVKPVESVRSFEDLNVGEQVFALGAPLGLEHTLSEGIISAKRFVGQAAYIQTTAAISPGSSGGGLFDSAGNLIGITTAMILNRERTSQALNFAIAADRFWNPAVIDPREESDSQREEKKTERFDPDISLQIGAIRLRLAGDVSLDKTQLKLLMQRNVDRERWNGCNLTLVRGSNGDAYKTYYRVRESDKERVESVEAKLPVAQLKTWSAEKKPRIYLCFSEYVRFDNENLQKLREAIARFEQLTNESGKP